jgi:hypothetical protein
MKRPRHIFFALALAAIGLAHADAKAQGVLAAAESAFERRDYRTALPLLQMLLEDNVDNRGVWLELKKRVLVCKNKLSPEDFEKLSWKPGMPRIVPKRETHPAPKAGEVLALSIKQLGNFDYDAEKGGTIPDDVKALSGTKVKIWGFIVPVREAENVTEFALVPSIINCCFGQRPGVQHVITVRMAKGTSTPITRDPISVTAILKVEEKREDDFTSSIFELEDASVGEVDKAIKDDLDAKMRSEGKW